MIERGLTGLDTAAKLRIDYRYFRNVISGVEQKCQPTRRKIEKFFGRKFWSNSSAAHNGRKPRNSKRST